MTSLCPVCHQGIAVHREHSYLCGRVVTVTFLILCQTPWKLALKGQQRVRVTSKSKTSPQLPSKILTIWMCVGKRLFTLLLAFSNVVCTVRCVPHCVVWFITSENGLLHSISIVRPSNIVQRRSRIEDLLQKHKDQCQEKYSDGRVDGRGVAGISCNHFNSCCSYRICWRYGCRDGAGGLGAAMS